MIPLACTPVVSHCRIEPLELRIAPAAVFVNATTVTYTDVDGDHVTVHSSKPIFNAGLANITTTASDLGDHLDQLVLGTTAAGAMISITATPSNVLSSGGASTSVAGDGLVNVGYINATGFDLAGVTVKGDLGQIDVGDSDTATMALKFLKVGSLGVLGASYGADITSDINGGLGSLVVTHDVRGAGVILKTLGTDGVFFKIGSIAIGGSLVGDTTDNSARIQTSGAIGAVKIGGGILGGAGRNSGQIDAGTTLGAVTVLGTLDGGDGRDSGEIHSGGSMATVKIIGSILGGDGRDSGKIDSGNLLGAVTVGGSLKGGQGLTSGQIHSTENMAAVKVFGDVKGGDNLDTGVISSKNGSIAGVTIGGSLSGGSFDNSGEILAKLNLGPVKISGNLKGGGIPTTGTLSITKTGYIQGKHITSVFIGGDVVSATNKSLTAGLTLTNSGAIHASDDIGSVVVAGSLIGNAETPVVISAKGVALAVASTSTTNIAIKSLVVNGGVFHAFIAGGYDSTGLAVNPDAQIGSITVKQDWVASNAVAGIQSTDANFGNSDDAVATAGTGFTDHTGIISKIGSIVIGGQVLGTADSVSATDSFAFEAQQIVSFKIGSIKVPLPTPSNTVDIRFSVPTNLDTHLREF